MNFFRVLRLLEKNSRGVLVGACIYEAVALSFPSKRRPPITELACNHKWFLPLFVVMLQLHVHGYKLSKISEALDV